MNTHHKAVFTTNREEPDDTTGQHRPVRLKPLPQDFQTELVQASERRQVRASEGSVRHVEVFRMDSVRTSILGIPPRLPRHRHAVPYTLICDEPDKLAITYRAAIVLAACTTWSRI